jgi:hypothetical protein
MNRDDLFPLDVEKNALLVLVEGRAYLAQPAAELADQGPADGPALLDQPDVPADLSTCLIGKSSQPVSDRRRTGRCSIEAKPQTAWRRPIFTHWRKVYYW